MNFLREAHTIVVNRNGAKWVHAHNTTGNSARHADLAVYKKYAFGMFCT